MQIFEIVVLVWLTVLTVGLLWVVFKIVSTQLDVKTLSKSIDLLTEDLKVVAKFTHTHEGKPSYTFNVKDLN